MSTFRRHRERERERERSMEEERRVCLLRRAPTPTMLQPPILPPFPFSFFGDDGGTGWWCRQEPPQMKASALGDWVIGEDSGEGRQIWW
ncbi:hypothetical protein L1987_32963 [Smallanthus sonchifolius]|uniref:Uncharacterized protein n=1 Tax=Smallanthus sonchifolius TaxID=185202 RepID=A0ACB9HPQ6_9ASTR|nr:hypothetical protein L1987_32963 [Smallanthus sonchifolius]